MTKEQGLVYLVGAGPGDPGLLTCRGLECIRRAEVMIYDGLSSPHLLTEAPADCQLIYAGKKRSRRSSPLKQEEINRLLVEHASQGRRVVRLKGGDPFVFGRGAEECQALAARGIRFEIVPGVSAATAVPAYAGVPLTARGVSSSAVLVTGHEADGKAAGQLDWSAVASNQTIVLFMAWKKIAACVRSLLKAGCSGETPAAAIRWGTTADQQTVTTTLEELPRVVKEAGIRPPMLVVIGRVVEQREQLAWYESRPLFGQRIWLTRHPERAASLSRSLRDLGAEPVVAATTRVVEGRPEDRAALAQALGELMRYQWLFLTSANGVRHFFRELRDMRLDARALSGIKIAAVGQATAAALEAHGLHADLQGHTGGLALARSLLQAEPDRPARVLFPRAELGRGEALEALREGGLEVDLRACYRSVTAPAEDLGLEIALDRLRAGELSGVAFFAPSQVQALVELEPDATRLLARVPVLAAIGETTARELESLGLTVHARPEKAHSSDLLEALVEAFS